MTATPLASHSGCGAQDVRQEELPPLEQDSDVGHSCSESVDDVACGHAGGVGLVHSGCDVGDLARDQRFRQLLSFSFECHFRFPPNVAFASSEKKMRICTYNGYRLIFYSRIFSSIMTFILIDFENQFPDVKL